MQAVPLRDKHGKIVKWYGALTDIEERKRAEEERERMRKLETELAHTNRVSMLGELTASLAHEVNQPIAATVASAGACLRWLGRDHPELERAREALTRIKDDGKRAGEIISRLKAFYRKGVSTQRELLDVNEVVGEMLVLLRREADRHAVAMKTELAADLPSVQADRVQLQQVLMNLMLNAIEAIGEAGGELFIRTRSAEGELAVSVSDSGVGLPADRSRADFQSVLHDEGGGNGNGAGNQPDDRGIARRKTLGRSERCARRNLSFHASRSRGAVTSVRRSHRLRDLTGRIGEQPPRLLDVRWQRIVERSEVGNGHCRDDPPI